MFYIFGGVTNDGNSNVIASFETSTRQWKKLGYLNEARFGHGVAIQQGEFIVVGGYSKFVTERCILNDDSIHCTTTKPQLQYYEYYPEMMSVSENYCPK